MVRTERRDRAMIGAGRCCWPRRVMPAAVNWPHVSQLQQIKAGGGDLRCDSGRRGGKTGRICLGGSRYRHRVSGTKGGRGEGTEVEQQRDASQASG